MKQGQSVEVKVAAGLALVLLGSVARVCARSALSKQVLAFNVNPQLAVPWERILADTAFATFTSHSALLLQCQISVFLLA